MRVYIRASAEKDLSKLPSAIQTRIIEKLEFYLQSGKPLSLAEPLHGKSAGNYRFHIGEYRIIFRPDEEDIIILAIGHRKDVYR